MSRNDRIINTTATRDEPERDRWGTNVLVVDWIVQHFGPIDFDGAADDETALVPRYAGQGGLIEDGLGEPWPDSEHAFCNPPYSRSAGGLEAWCRAMFENSRRFPVTGLFFSRTETKAWHNYVSKAHIVYFIKRRLKFIDPATREVKGFAPAPSVIVHWRPDYEGPPAYRNLDFKHS